MKITCIAVVTLLIVSCKNDVVTLQNEIIISGLSFSPNSLTVQPGTTVTWLNNESVTHTVTSDSTLFDSGNLVKGDKFNYTFTKSGTYAYHCKYHSGMTGKIIVSGGTIPNQVIIAGFNFAPATLTVAVGASVTWTNNDAATHTVTSNTTAFDSGDMTQGKSFTFKFTTAGTYAYHCIYHSNMTGIIVVQ